MLRLLLLISSLSSFLIPFASGASQYSVRGYSHEAEILDSLPADPQTTTWQIHNRAIPYSKTDGNPRTGSQRKQNTAPLPKRKTESNVPSQPNKNVPPHKPRMSQKDSRYPSNNQGVYRSKGASSPTPVPPSGTEGPPTAHIVQEPVSNLERRHQIPGEALLPSHRRSSMEGFGQSRDLLTYDLEDSHPSVLTRAELIRRSLSIMASMKPTTQQVLHGDPKASTTDDAILKRDSGSLTSAEYLAGNSPNKSPSPSRGRIIDSAHQKRPNLMVRGDLGGHHNKMKHKSTIHESGANMLAAALE